MLGAAAFLTIPRSDATVHQKQRAWVTAVALALLTCVSAQAVLLSFNITTLSSVVGYIDFLAPFLFALGAYLGYYESVLQQKQSEATTDNNNQSS